jgi:hypothetical protein
MPGCATPQYSTPLAGIEVAACPNASGKNVAARLERICNIALQQSGFLLAKLRNDPGCVIGGHIFARRPLDPGGNPEFNCAGL